MCPYFCYFFLYTFLANTYFNGMSALKLISGALGFVLGGPIGAILGVGAAFLFEGITRGRAETTNHSRNFQRTDRNDFTLSLLVLIAGVVKADGKIKKSEIDFVKGHFISVLGLQGAQEAMRILKGIMEQPIPLEAVSRQISENMDYAYRLELVHLLYAVAAADKEIHSSEVDCIAKIAHHLGISPKDLSSIAAMFFASQTGPYDILEIAPDCSNDEIKKAYRLMAQKFHPDKVAHLGEDYQLQARKKFENVNEAYETLKEQRGF